jgi:8-oxo-dGTP pyrophosphatase MutT (NUDIX family)
MSHQYVQQITCVRQALAYTTTICLDELLVPRDSNRLLARKMEPEPGVVPRRAAVLVLLYPHEEELWLPLTVRSTRLPHHSGEVSLPGGAADPEDDGPVGTALRETHEEIGIAPEQITIWGTLSRLYIPASNFSLKPVVGFMPHVPLIIPNHYEIAEVFSVPLRVLRDPSTVVTEEWDLHGVRAHVPFFAVHGYKVWGATAFVLSELVARLRRVQCPE